VRGRPVLGKPVCPPTVQSIDHQYCTLNGYDWQAYVVLVRQLFIFTPCLLCGQLHVLKIRAFLWRKVRSPEDGLNTEIIIILIFCKTAKEQGWQYTKRLLPPFVIPYCVICREPVMAYIRQYPDGAIHSAIASPMMGTIDIRTIRRHVRLAMHLIKDASLQLWEFLSGLSGYASLPAHRPGASPLESLDKAAQEMDRAATRVQGCSAETIPVLVYVHALNVYTRARNPIVPVPTLVLQATFFHDTS